MNLFMKVKEEKFKKQKETVQHLNNGYQRERGIGEQSRQATNQIMKDGD